VNRADFKSLSLFWKEIKRICSENGTKCEDAPRSSKLARPLRLLFQASASPLQSSRELFNVGICLTPAAVSRKNRTATRPQSQPIQSPIHAAS
jgi:hypothetical protein